VEGFGGDYAETLRHWAERLDARASEAERIAGAERVRVFRLYLRAARNGFRNGFLSVYQVLCQRTAAVESLCAPGRFARPTGW
jgi:cyclopropane-fatty-acyl-phospholipid synthase